LDAFAHWAELSMRACKQNADSPDLCLAYCKAEIRGVVAVVAA